jgi:hypothetical protein
MRRTISGPRSAQMERITKIKMKGNIRKRRATRYAIHRAPGASRV